jgi:hypothetical protein
MPADVRYLRTVDASRLLGLTPSQLRDLEQRFGFPTSRRSPRGQRIFAFDEVVALSNALLAEPSVAAAVAVARENVAEGNADSLYAAFVAFDRNRCRQAMETAAGLRSLESVIEDVLVRALDLLASTHDAQSPQWMHAAEFATEWLHTRIGRTLPPTGIASILLANAARDDLDRDGVFITSLELLCRRIGCEVVSGPVGWDADFATIDGLDRPDALVIAGGYAGDDLVIPWTEAMRRKRNPGTVAMYRRQLPSTSLLAAQSTTLPASPLAAQRRIIDLIDQAQRPIHDGE